MNYDAIIIGTGSGGGVLADRLTDNTGNQVLVLEAGPDFETMYPGTDASDERSRLRSVRANCTQYSTDTHHWGYTDSSSNQIPCGKNVGGSGAHNAMQSYRGTRVQHSLWPEGWRYDDMEPYYEEVGRRMNVRPVPRFCMDPATLAFERAALDLGYPQVEDFNRLPNNDLVRGVGPQSYNARGLVDPRASQGLLDKYGGRQGPLEVYIRPARSRPNLTLIPDVFVERVLYEPTPSGWHAIGVTYIDRDGESHTAEGWLVIASAGAFGSPTLLMRSGIGPGLAADLPQVGRNYVAQITGAMTVEYDKPLHSQFGYPYGTALQVDYDRPDQSYLIGTFASGTAAVIGSQWGRNFKRDARNWRNWGVVYFIKVFSRSVGTVTLDPTQPNGAAIDFAFVPEDVTFLESKYAEAQRILSNIDRVDAGIRVKNVLTSSSPNTSAHPQGTCRMGNGPADSVVDLNLVVHGFDNLMVVDASVMPAQVQSPHYPTSALAHKIADSFIRRDLWGIGNDL